MPYEIRKQGDQFCVYNKQTGEKRACHDSQEKAVAQMRLLYGIESGAIKKELNSSDGSVIDICQCDACMAVPETVTEDGMEVKAVWTSSYISSLPDSSFAYIEPGCNDKGCRHFPIKDKEGNYDAAHVRNALSRAPQSPFGSKAMPKIEAGARALGIGDHKKNVVDTVLDWFKPAGSQALTLTKQADGRTRVLLRVSNIFKDRHGEIITEAAHKEYEAYVNETKAYPEFWLWHTPGSRWGQADLVSYDDGFLTMSGLVDQGKEYIAEALATKLKDIGVSHGFKALSIQGKGYIDWYRTFEASPLPLDQAANVWTGMMLAKEWEMGLADKQKKFFESLGLPEAVISEWDSDSKQLSEKLKAAGIEFKDMESLFKEEASGEVAAQTETVAPQVQVDDPILAELKKLSERFDGLESKQKELETKVKDSVAETMAAAVIPGAPAGYVASKQGEAPSDTESAANKQWEEELANLILGAK